MDSDFDEFPPDLLKLAFVGGYQEGLTDLAELAEDEDWDYKNAQTDRTNPVLTNYIVYTYRRLVEERKIAISPDGLHLCFNTGLVTNNQEEIYAVFEPNKRETAGQKWFLQGWEKRSSHALSRFSALPDLAQYYDNPELLIFDPRKELRVNLDHIIEDNRERFPTPYNTLDAFALRNFLSGAVDSFKIRVKRNYKTAIPQYYKGRIQLLLPICLSNPKVADLALTVELFGDHYRASTCLTLDMAYNNARQLARPDKDWLQP
ncbi:DUF3825 domain-containing protein [Rhodovulum euryhalinum]|uniref:Uncharacterized protein DUF3825 n=1 Tax=Rhodovulum euryhalinum TaxID=35805 RepID=A0A4R2KC65_9RHOB|nr:DUF3825 domain-containing protein [Rhodovulum euryhalinum]TCO71111.1 uncharacterized protein DUF3825 [Rhodovulum euryhalinum]